MCGICGFIDPSLGLGQSELKKMNDTIARRGPDGEGYFLAQGVGLAMRRLAIQDLDGGQQPIFNEDGSICVVFNGEIYNFNEIRAQLEEKGHQFRTKSDTEVLVHLYEEYGVELLHHLQGMFAFALYDIKGGKVIIARDRLGIKPLFYTQETSGRVLFGSEIKTILRVAQGPKKLDYDALDAYLTFTYIPAPLTIYRGICKLEPGHYLVVEEGQIYKHKYWDLDFNNPVEASDSLLENLEQELLKAVSSHLVSDVPVGAFLSGGIDSSLVASMMQSRLQERVSTFTVGFTGKSIHVTDERNYARLLAERYDLDYNEYTVQADFREICGELIEAFDEPFADDSIIPSYYVCKETAKKVKVALSGLGGDELFAGYNRYTGFILSQQLAKLPRFLIRKVIQPLVGRLPEFKNGGDRVDHIKRFFRYLDKPASERYLGYVSSLDPDERSRLYAAKSAARVNFEQTSKLITGHFENCKSLSDMERVLYADIKTYLPEDILALSDRLSMWHSLELRVPLIDHKLAEFTTKVPLSEKISGRNKKISLKKVAESWLPESIIKHKKQGFEAPMAGWLKNELKGFMVELLSNESLARHGLFNPQYVQGLIQDHLQGKRKNNKIIFSLIMFQLWFNHQQDIEL